MDLKSLPGVKCKQYMLYLGWPDRWICPVVARPCSAHQLPLLRRSRAPPQCSDSVAMGATADTADAHSKRRFWTDGSHCCVPLSRPLRRLQHAQPASNHGSSVAIGRTKWKVRTVGTCLVYGAREGRPRQQARTIVPRRLNHSGLHLLGVRRSSNHTSDWVVIQSVAEE